MESFANKLAFVIKALSISRGRLGQELGVDKSVTSRWLSGVRVPTANNMAAITALVAARVPGFTMLDWDMDVAGLAAQLSVAGARAGNKSATTERGAPLLPCAIEARGEIAARGARFEGHWSGWRVTFQDRHSYSRDVYRIRRSGDFLAVEGATGSVTAKGWFVPSDGKAFVILINNFVNIPTLLLLYAGESGSVNTLDGLLMTVTALASRAIVAAPYVMRRHAPLLPNPADDDRLFSARAAEHNMFERDAVPREALDRLSIQAPVDRDLRMPADGSLAGAGTVVEELAAAAAAAAFLATGEVRGT